jgi:ferredoxin
MPRLRIDDIEVEVGEGATILDAARAAGVEIPTLCHREGLPPSASCLVCVVKVNGSDRLVPACATTAQEGMVIESDTEEVRRARRMALELLLGDHLGDCLGPCQVTCPAQMDIPKMIRHIAHGRLREAIATVKEHIALPAVLGRICPEPCEKACRRGAYDQPVAIRLLKRYVADVDLASEQPYLPPRKTATGRQVAVIGAGPAGLSAAYYLLRDGHEVVLLDEHDRPGGALRYGVAPDRLPHEVLDGEVGLIAELGAQFRLGRRVGRDILLGDLRQEFDAVLVAAGELDEDAAAQLGLPMAGRGLKADKSTLATDLRGVFVAGSALSPSRLAVRAVASGRAAAQAISQHLASGQIIAAEREFNVQMGRLDEEELAEFASEASQVARLIAGGGEATGFNEREARQEALRCLRCDCRKLRDCKLRRYAMQYGARPKRYTGERRRFVRDLTHPEVIYEPGKCITCGLCIEIASRAKEELGLTFVGRGFEVRAAVPFDEGISEGLKEVARECVEACPTGALALRDEEKPATPDLPEESSSQQPGESRRQQPL